MKKMKMEDLLTENWKEQIKTLPEEIREKLREYSEIRMNIQLLRFQSIDIQEFQKRMERIINNSKNQ